MVVWGAVWVLVSAVSAIGPFRGSLPVWLESIAQLAAVVSAFVLVCSVEAGGANRHNDSTGSA